METEMKNEVRYYLGLVKDSMDTTDTDAFVPVVIVTAVKLPTGAVEITTNTQDIGAKIDYILEAYDEHMRLKTNSEVVMQNLMIV